VDYEPTTDTVAVASGFGPKADWYQNLLAHPETTMRIGSRSLEVHARRLYDKEAATAMVSYARRRPRTAKALASFMGFQVDGSEHDYHLLGHRLPMLRLTPS
jgi:deazaflavin-dependent oxidoreductase (nitroreductase family)